MNNGTILQLDGDRLIVEFHQEPKGQLELGSKQAYR